MKFPARALHYVFRVADREASYKFYTQVLGMKVLRHEEFEEGCKADCNGPYDNLWSKTMIGYGDEDHHFVLELTYNYGISSYQLGNDFKAIHINSDRVFDLAKSKGCMNEDGTISIKDPNEHCFCIAKGDLKEFKYPVTKVSLNVKNLKESKDFWSNLLGMDVGKEDENTCLLSYGPDQCELELNQLKDATLERKTAFGRIAFSTPTENLKMIEDVVGSKNKNYIQTSFVSLETPGKATVSVVILRDPNDHEICFVGQEGFQQLSKTDPDADKAIQEAIKKDESRK